MLSVLRRLYAVSTTYFCNLQCYDYVIAFIRRLTLTVHLRPFDRHKYVQVILHYD